MARLLIIGSLLLCTSCEKDELDKLPSATQTGANTMGCLVDGTAWKPAQGEARLLSGALIDPIYASYRGGSLDISFDYKGETSIGFWIPRFRQLGPIQFNQDGNTPTSSTRPYAIYTIDYGSSTTYYTTGSTAQGSLTITRLDSVARIVSGTFEFVGRQDNGSTVKITQGRFDVQLR